MTLFDPIRDYSDALEQRPSALMGVAEEIILGH